VIDNGINVKQNIAIINEWFISNGILNDHVKNNIILYVMSSSPFIKDATLFIDSNNKSIGVLVYLSRWDMFFKSNGIYRDLKKSLSEYLFNYNINLNFKLYKKEEKNGQKKVTSSAQKS